MAEFNVRPMPGKGEDAVIRHHWADEKRCRSLSITQDCWKILGALANDCGNRSEVVEIITRYAWNANLDLSSIRTELLNPEVAAKAGISDRYVSSESRKACERSEKYHESRPEGTYPAKKKESSDACNVEVDFDAPIQTAEQHRRDASTAATPAVSQCSI